ncbi:uncharacterized protein LOC117807416 isoform X2 [Notolabrus celidotus]|uniref:uncharacterized protein LOC117807416 isoform X2 n=1 Tax=Notolabrus celidotus TaxID=1203425 RepID=UPI001490666C|nr:uncharacterized protein LOC117807416 isoform X2 [Notolabrus celidotus]
MEAVGQVPWGRFVSTYRKDYGPFSERHLQVNQPRHITDVRAAPSFINPLPTGLDFWATFYKTTNSVYGSPVYSQPLLYSLPPTPLPQSGVLATHDFGAVDSALTEARTQDTEAEREAWPVVGVGEKDQLHYVLGGKVSEQQEAKGDPQRKVEVLYEDACCKDLARSTCGEAGLQYQLHLPVVPGAITTIKGADHLDISAFLRGLTACGQQNHTFLQPFPRQCSCCACETEFPNSCCFKQQTFPLCIHHGGTRPVAPVQATVNYREPSRKPLLTEYQAGYAAEWAQPNIQQSYCDNVRLLHHQILCHSL